MDTIARGGRRRISILVAAAITVGGLGWRAAPDGVAGSSRAAENPCTAPGGPLDPACLPDGTALQLFRQLCSYQWLGDVCASTAFEDPGYAATTEPNPGAPLALKVGAVHEHSSYSDGDPAMIPADYFGAAKWGHNAMPDGGDTGVKLDFMFSSEHSDNAQIPITTSADCLTPRVLECQHLEHNDDYWKWPATLRQAREATGGDFTAMRGFEYTNDYFNHINVYFSTNFVNVKIDGSYASMDIFYDWLREPVAEGGGADGLITFNHPGGEPNLTPFDGGMPHNEVLAQFPGRANWDNYAHVPDLDERVAGMEVNGGDDIAWFVTALTNGWHIGPVAAEDEHQRKWSSSAEGKTLLLTRGRSYQDYYWALSQHRSVAVKESLIDGAPGTKATYPTVHFWAGGNSINDRSSTVMGGTRRARSNEVLHVELANVPAGRRVALVPSAGGQAAAIQLGAVGPNGRFSSSTRVTSPAQGEAWWFAVVCPADTGEKCGTDDRHEAVTAPIWLTQP